MNSNLRVAHDRMELRAVGPGRVSTFFSPKFPELNDWADAGESRFKQLLAGKTRTKNKLSVCLITDATYWTETLGLIFNLLREHAGPLEIFLLSLDGFAVGEIVPISNRIRYHVVSLSDLWTERELLKLENRSMAIQAYCSKSRLCRWAITKTKKPVLYLDSDIYFFRSPYHLVKRLENYSVLLFPHWNDDSAHTRLHGLFNAGMLGVSPKGVDFLDWWAKLCLVKCSKEAGFFDDQGYLDLVPIYFKNVGIYRRGDENVAKWNIKTLNVSVGALTGVRMGTQHVAVGSVHTPGTDSLGLFEAKVAWDQLVAFHSLQKSPLESQQRLFERVWQLQRRYVLELDELYRIYESARRRLPAIPAMTEEKLHWWWDRRKTAWGKMPRRLFHAVKRLAGRAKAEDAPENLSRWVKLQQRWLEQPNRL